MCRQLVGTDACEGEKEGMGWGAGVALGGRRGGGKRPRPSVTEVPPHEGPHSLPPDPPCEQHLLLLFWPL